MAMQSFSKTFPKEYVKLGWHWQTVAEKKNKLFKKDDAKCENNDCDSACSEIFVQVS